MSLICLDTNILIWGIKKECTDGQEYMVEQACRFFQSIDNNKTKVIIPSIVISELLMPVNESEHSNLLNALNKFTISPFDLAAASAFAKIWKAYNESNTIISQHISKNHIKVDCQIIAIAYVNKVNCLYSHDNDIKKIAHGFVNVEKLPEYVIQKDLSLNGKTLSD